MGWLVNEFVVAQIVTMARINPRLLLAKSWSASDDPPKVDTKVGGENTHPAQTAFLFMHTLSLVAFTAVNLLVKTLALFLPTIVQVPAFVLAAHRHSYSVSDDVLSLNVLQRQYSEKKPLCVQTTLIHCAHHSLRRFVVTEDIHLSQVMRPSTIQ